ncbi:import component protein [Pedobacter lusitanus]|uniref:Contig89, whole genome shotgun sequence n=1 Tax=Pedobacter lusitanus TaxID=1503925 RepID=A0A0D0FT85_9SPHI|nr:import component protein [Pedobacter lusitanus]KIO75659.1 import component protein [Pedobacter lusitanus]
MNSKTLSIVSYITLIGWLVAYFSGKENADSLLKYHLRQALGLAIVSIIFNVVLTIIASIVPSLAFLSLAGWVIVVLWIMGIIHAANEAQKPVPLIGKMFENKFAFIG